MIAFAFLIGQDMISPKSLQVLYLDNHLLVVDKPARMLVQGDASGDVTLLQLARGYIKKKFNKPGAVYLGLVHRLDRPVSGVVIFAKTSKAAARLHIQFKERRCRKIYWALVHGKTPRQGAWSDWLVRRGPTSYIGTAADGCQAHLYFRRLGYHDRLSWVEIELQTGRHHQIRVQFAHRGYPILGDFRYGIGPGLAPGVLALHARSLTITHPTRYRPLTFSADPDADYWPQHFML